MTDLTPARLANLKYHNILIPFEPDPRKRTIWHPVTDSGPFAVLSRGAFDSETEAHEWAAKHLNGTAYTVRLIGG